MTYSTRECLDAQLATLGYCHVQAPSYPLSCAAEWLAGSAAAGQPLPLGLAYDLGCVLRCGGERRALARPAHLPGDEDTGGYLAFLERISSSPLARHLPCWHATRSFDDFLNS